MRQPVRYAYLDESGQQARDWVTVAGFVGIWGQWKTFFPLWRTALGPQRQHLTRASRLRWRKPEQHRDMFERLGPVPYAAGLEPVHGSVHVPEYFDLIEGTTEKKIYGAYCVCLQFAVGHLLHGLPDGEALFVVLEQQEPYREAAIGHMRALQRLYGSDRFAGWDFVDKGVTPALEAADCLAFAVRHLYTDPTSGKSIVTAPLLGPQRHKTLAYGGRVPQAALRRMTARAMALNAAQGL